jgi:selenoprotein W-related protein
LVFNLSLEPIYDDRPHLLRGLRIRPKAVSLAAKILTAFKQRIASLRLIPSKGGCFELVVEGELVYSKLKTGLFPDEDTIVKAVEDRLR